MIVFNQSEAPEFVRTLARGYAALLIVGVALTPIIAVGYLYYFQNPGLLFEEHSFHVLAIGISLLQSGFIAYVTWRCYLQSGEQLLLWLTLGFLAFTVIYSLHGAFTHVSHDNEWLFLLYGPASRLIMAACMLAGLINQGLPAHTVAQRHHRRYWLAGLSAFVVSDVVVFMLAFSSWAPASRWVMEVLAMCITLTCALIIVARPIRSSQMTIFLMSLLFFAQSSGAFLLGAMWTHMWWLAHAVFATGFMVLSYGVIRAFLTTGSFTAAFSQVDLLAQIKNEKVRAEDALIRLQRANEELLTLATTDVLTGAINRREFETRADREISRVKRSGASFSLVAIDLDHFKEINDKHGHRAGDEVLRAFVSLAQKSIRPIDLIGRLGGEEFALMLPGTTLEGAAVMAERLRQHVEEEVVAIADTHLRFTASLGVAQYGRDGENYESMIEVADNRMYRAKQQGRNQVVIQ